MAKTAFQVCAQYKGNVTFNQKEYARFTVVGTGTLIHIPIERAREHTLSNGAFYLVEVYPRSTDTENYLSFNLRCELTLPKYGESLA